MNGRINSNLRNREVVLTYIKQRSLMTTRELAKKTGWTRDYLRALLRWLYRDGLVMFYQVGSTKHWSACQPLEITTWHYPGE